MGRARVCNASPMAVALGSAEVLIDDRAARRCAASLGLEMTGSLGIIALAKHRGVIDSASVALRALVDNGLRVSPTLLNGLLAHLGELK